MSTESEHTKHSEMPLSLTQEQIRQSDNLNRQITKALNQLPPDQAKAMMYRIADWEIIVHKHESRTDDDIRQSDRDGWKKDVYFVTLLEVIRTNFPSLSDLIERSLHEYFQGPTFVRYMTGQTVYSKLFLGKPAVYLYKTITSSEGEQINFYQDLSRMCAFYHLDKLDLDENTPHPTLAAAALIRVVGKTAIDEYEAILKQMA